MKNPHPTENEQALLDAGEFLWIVLANTSNGHWRNQSEEWQKAAAKARDDFHAVAKKLNARVA